MSAREYICVECGGRDFTPHQGRDCRHCGRWHCLGCLPDHEGSCQLSTVSCQLDRQGFSVERRYTLITGYYLEETHLARAGHWDLNKIREWAEVLWLPLNVISQGICRAVDRATSRGDAIYAFGYIEPHIIAAARQYREASAGLGPQAHPIPRENSAGPPEVKR